MQSLVSRHNSPFSKDLRKTVSRLMQNSDPDPSSPWRSFNHAMSVESSDRTKKSSVSGSGSISGSVCCALVVVTLRIQPCLSTVAVLLGVEGK